MKILRWSVEALVESAGRFAYIVIGNKFAHYEITSHLGTGGMSEVYQATDSKLGRSVAIKLLPEAFTHDSQRAARFEREARLLASHILLLPLDGERKTKAFLNTPASESDPSFSRDGNWIAYVSDETGRSEICVRPFPGPGAKVQISTEGGSSPVWSRDGRELFFLNGNKMMAVDVATRPAFSAGPPHVLFQERFARSGTGIPSFDVDKDGRFLMVPDPRTEQATTQVNVVLNWFEELKKLVPVR